MSDELKKRKIGFIDYLINNGGCFYPTFTKAKNGFEIMFVTNYLSHFYLTLQVLKHNYNYTKQINNGKSINNNTWHENDRPTLRVINVASVGHMFIRPLKLKHMLKQCLKNSSVPQDSKKEFKMGQNYGVSKALLMLHARGLYYKFNIDKKSKYYKYGKMFNVEAVSLHPGIINTNLFDNVEVKSNIIIDFFNQYIIIPMLNLTLLKTIEQGCATTIRCVVMKSNQIENGAYYDSCQLAKIRYGITEKDYSNADIAWQWSKNLIEKAGFDLSDL